LPAFGLLARDKSQDRAALKGKLDLIREKSNLRLHKFYIHNLASAFGGGIAPKWSTINEMFTEPAEIMAGV
jgi:hypothetical protein